MWKMFVLNLEPGAEFFLKNPRIKNEGNVKMSLLTETGVKNIFKKLEPNFLI